MGVCLRCECNMGVCVGVTWVCVCWGVLQEFQVASSMDSCSVEEIQEFLDGSIQGTECRYKQCALSSPGTHRSLDPLEI